MSRVFAGRSSGRLFLRRPALGPLLALLSIFSALTVGAPAQTSSSNSQPLAAPAPPYGSGEPANHVLELEGNGSCVELPPDIFTNLTEATVEGWLKWKRFAPNSRFFDFGKEGQLMAVRNSGTGPDLVFEISRNNKSPYIEVLVPGILSTNRWFHIAAVSGPGGMKLYVNGALAGSNTHAGSFAWMGSDEHNYLGRSNWRQSDPGNNEDFQGQMVEVRVWKVQRTEDQIRETMFRRLTGREPGLAGLWNFDRVANGAVKDLTPGAHDGKLIGHARVAEVPPPTGVQAALSGQVLDLDGTNSAVELPPNLFTNAVVTVEGWMKWREFGVFSRFFDFADASLLIGLNSRGAEQKGPSTTVQVDHYRAAGFDDLYAIRVPNVLFTNQWVHLAVVAGKDFSKLYLNGALLSANEARFDWKPGVLPPRKNFLGRSVTGSDPNANGDTDLDGQMAEVRLWAGERTAEEIKTNLFKNLTGREAGLLALWNFADGTAHDASTNGRDGKLIGNARVISAQLPTPAGLREPDLGLGPPGSVLLGRVSDSAGKPLAAVQVQLFKSKLRTPNSEQEPNASALVDTNEVIAIALTHSDGRYHFRRVMPGQYVLRAQSPPGWVWFDDVKPIVVRAGVDRPDVDFQLPVRQPVAGPPPQPRAPTVC